MTVKSIIFIATLFAAQFSLADSISINMSLDTVVSYDFTPPNILTQTSTTSSGSMTIDIDMDGELISMNQKFPHQVTSGSDTMMIETSDKKIRFIDTKEDINQVISVVRTDSGFVIEADVYESLYTEAMKRVGLDALKGLNMEATDVSVDISLQFSDCVCTAAPETNEVNCEQNVTMKIHATDK